MEVEAQACSRCMDCPKYDVRIGWCPIRAERRPGNGPACGYGQGLIVKKRRRRSK